MKYTPSVDGIDRATIRLELRITATELKVLEDDAKYWELSIPGWRHSLQISIEQTIDQIIENVSEREDESA